MLFYFSGTGNSFYVARQIAQQQQQNLLSMAEAVNQTTIYEAADNEPIGFVFPVYAWGPPKIVLAFIEKMQIHNLQKNYVFCVITCGDSVGDAMRATSTALAKRGMKIDAAFSVTMPNNYILLGDVDSKSKEAKKLAAAEETLQQINHAIEQRAQTFRVKKGPCAWLLTEWVYPLFMKYAVNPRKFYADEHCTSCGLCQKLCSCQNITVGTKPQWGQNCTQCLACLHYCPMQAVQYGTSTKKKGRYTNPNVSLTDRLSQN